MTKIHKHDYGIVHVKFNTINVIISMFSSIAEDHGSFSSCVKQKTIKWTFAAAMHVKLSRQRTDW